MIQLYLVVLNEAISVVLVIDGPNGPRSVYYIRHSLQGAKAHYTNVEKLVLALMTHARKLRPYFQAYHTVVLTNFPLKQVERSPQTSRRLAKLAIELSEHDVEFQPHPSIRSKYWPILFSRKDYFWPTMHKDTKVCAYNSKVRQQCFQVDDLVLRKAEFSRAVGKLDLKREGTYKVVEIVNAGAYRLQHLDGRDVPRTWMWGTPRNFMLRFHTYDSKKLYYYFSIFNNVISAELGVKKKFYLIFPLHIMYFCRFPTHYLM